MKIRYITIVLILICWLSLHSLTIMNYEREISLSVEELREMELIEIMTEREDERGVRIDNWQGVLLSDIFDLYDIDDFARLKFNSYDGYQVRVSEEEARKYPVLIALQRNGKAYEEDDLRLVIPGMREMFWMHAVKTIQTEDESELAPPYYIFFAEDLLDRFTIAEDPEPFRNVQGYYLVELLSLVYPFQQDEYLLTGRDGVSHQLDFETYLASAVLADTEKGYTLQGGDIPYGMWIKNIAYIQCYDRAIIFREQFENLKEISNLLEWHILPEYLLTAEREKISIELDFTAEDWRDKGVLRWEK